MSRRKQLRPVAMKGDCEDDAAEAKKSRLSSSSPLFRHLDGIVVKTEDSSDDSPMATADPLLLGQVLLNDVIARSIAPMDIQCMLCEARFASIGALQMHTISAHAATSNTVPPPGTVACPQCDASLPDLPAFAAHMRSIHLLAEVPCGFCSRVFADPSDRDHHVAEHLIGRVTRLACGGCPGSEGFVDAAEYGSHCMEAHARLRIACGICDAVTDGELAYRMHAMEHVERRIQLVCTPCQVPFTSKDAALAHIRDFHSGTKASSSSSTLVDNSKTLLPPAFLLPGPLAGSLLQAVINSSTPSPRNSKASNGESTVAKEAQLTSRRETSTRPLHCSVCDERCGGEEALDEHRLKAHCKIHHSSACAECHLPLGDSLALFESHCRGHASSAGVVSCVVCRQSLRSEHLLGLHAEFHGFHPSTSSPVGDEGEGMREEEEEEEPTSTTTTPLPPPLKTEEVEEREPTPQPSTSTAIEKYDEPMQMLSGLPPLPTVQLPPSEPRKIFRCWLCGFRFHSQSRLDVHIKKHSMATSATCQICGDQFKRQEDLAVHMRAHKASLKDRAGPIAVNGV